MSGHTHGSAERNISFAFFLNLFFAIVELVGGLLTNSMAILSDALHDFGDSLSLGVAWLLARKSRQPRNKQYTYGYKRFSLLGSIFLSGVLTLSSILVLIESGKRIASPQEVSAEGMLWIAIFGVIVNGAAAFKVKQGHSLNERAVYLHIMEDVLGWIGVLAVSIVMLFVEVPMLDSLLSIGISLWVLSNVYKNLRDTFEVLLQAIPKDVPVEELSARIQALESVASIHDLHLWSLDGASHVMSLHVVTAANEVAPLKQAIVSLAREYNIEHITVEFEGEGTLCLTNCDATPPHIV